MTEITTTGITHDHVLANIVRIQNLCRDSSNGATMMEFVSERMQLVMSALKVLWQNQSSATQDDKLIVPIHSNLKALKASIKKLCKMNRIVYLIQAHELHEELFHGPEMTALSEAILKEYGCCTNTDYYISADAAATGIAQFRRECEKQESEFDGFQQAVKEEHADWAALETTDGGKFLQQLKQVLGDDVTLKEIQNAERVLHLELADDAQNNSDLPAAALEKQQQQQQQQQAYLTQMVELLANASAELAEEEGVHSQEPLFPAWALDPVTNKPLINPVTVRAECNHTASKATLEEWLRQGNKNCPVCQATLKALCGTPNKKLAKCIQKLLIMEEEEKEQCLNKSGKEPQPCSEGGVSHSQPPCSASQLQVKAAAVVEGVNLAKWLSSSSAAPSPTSTVMEQQPIATTSLAQIKSFDGSGKQERRLLVRNNSGGSSERQRRRQPAVRTNSEGSGRQSPAVRTHSGGSTGRAPRRAVRTTSGGSNKCGGSGSGSSGGVLRKPMMARNGSGESVVRSSASPSLRMPTLMRTLTGGSAATPKAGNESLQKPVLRRNLTAPTKPTASPQRSTTKSDSTTTSRSLANFRMIRHSKSFDNDRFMVATADNKPTSSSVVVVKSGKVKLKRSASGGGGGGGGAAARTGGGTVVKTSNLLLGSSKS